MRQSARPSGVIVAAALIGPRSLGERPQHTTISLVPSRPLHSRARFRSGYKTGHRVRCGMGIGDRSVLLASARSDWGKGALTVEQHRSQNRRCGRSVRHHRRWRPPVRRKRASALRSIAGNGRLLADTFVRSTMEPMRGWQMTSLNRNDELLAHIRAPHCDL